MSTANDIDGININNQIRRDLRVIAGRDVLEGTYNVSDVDGDGRVSTRNYVWDSDLMQWVAMSTGGPSNVNWDALELSYTGSDLTGVVYKMDGTTVQTLALGYTNGNLTSVTRTLPNE